MANLSISPIMVHALYGGLLAATMNELYAPRRQWALEQLGHDFSFDVRLGSGRKTYLRHNYARTEFLITYGQQLIPEFFCSTTASKWLSYHELRTGYLIGQNITPLDHLAHLVIHEFAHWIQVVLGQRYDGSVHNDAFYTILDKAYRKDIPGTIRHHILAATESNEHLRLALQEHYDLSGHVDPSMLRPGLPMHFISKEGMMECVILKVNRTRVEAKVDQRRILIPFSLLRRPEGSFIDTKRGDR